jgi:GNAT superfamily N-acetyltransferase
MATSDDVWIASRSDEDDVSAVITLAFCADPMVQWIWPNPRHRMTTFMRLVPLYGGPAFDHGSAYVVGNFAGAALWLPPGVTPEEEPMMRLFEQNVEKDVLRTYLSLFEKTSAYHPSEAHWSLPLIGVDPAQHGKGIGGKLMAHALAACDQDQELAYLESTNRANLSLYKRHGFRLLAELQVGQSPKKFAMLREPL